VGRFRRAKKRANGIARPQIPTIYCLSALPSKRVCGIITPWGRGIGVQYAEPFKTAHFPLAVDH
jgi:hypothetical protein